MGDYFVEFVVVGEETLNRMVREFNPYVASVFLSGKPIQNEGYAERIKSRINRGGLRKWARKYRSEGLKIIGEKRG